MRARLRDTYRYKTAILLNGMEFSKASWIDIPRGKEALAKANFSDLLEFDGLEEEPQEEIGEPVSPSEPEGIEARTVEGDMVPPNEETLPVDVIEEPTPKRRRRKTKKEDEE